MDRPGTFIVVDGLVGSGKSTLLNAVHDWAKDCGHTIFRLKDWTQSEPPTFNDVKDADIIFTYEPTRTWVGAAIRHELSQTENPYGGEELAHAFALDRQIMYRHLIIPALKAGKIIIQDRCVASSLVYQPVMPNSVPLETVMALPGNKLSLEYAPDALILTDVDAQVAAERIKTRDDDSKGVFAQLEFMKQQAERYKSPWLHEIFTKHGTQLFNLDTSGTLEESKTNATQIIDQILKTC
jgi:dTMP kinase